MDDYDHQTSPHPHLISPPFGKYYHDKNDDHDHDHDHNDDHDDYDDNLGDDLIDNHVLG